LDKLSIADEDKRFLIVQHNKMTSNHKIVHSFH